MGGSKQPYIYQPVSYGPFNPKAYTQSLATPAPARPVQTGPLITFNRHPDSYDNLPYGRNVGIAPMSSRSKKGVVWARKMQLALRLVQLLAAVAVLVCVITIKGAPDTQGWILRLPPAFDLATSTYGVWHLAHAATHRPPASASSYHAFALLMDTGLIPFYAFTSILTKDQFERAADDGGRWRTMFNTTDATNTIFHITWIAAAVVGGLHAVSLIVSAYLVVMFRKIANMPPDMNPLEDNLTSRNKTKHKYKNSDMSALVGEEKRFSDISARTGKTSDMDDLRMSQTSERLMGDPRSSGVSFFHSRTAQDKGYSPHNPDTARQSWVIEDPNFYRDPDVYKHKGSPRHSRADLDRNRSIQEYGTSRITSSMPNIPQISKRSSIASPIAVYDEAPDNVSAVSGDNWEVIDPSDNISRTSDDFDPYRTSSGKPYASVPQEEDYYNMQPLRMNPPTPELHNPSPISPLSHLSQGYHHEDKENAHDERTQTITSTSSSQYSESAPAAQASQNNASQPKSRFYTDLAAAMRGVRHEAGSKAPKSVAGSVHTHLSSSTNNTTSSRVAPAVAGDLRIKTSGTVVRKPLKSYDEIGQTGFTVAKSSPSRVVSRTGVDVDVMDFGGDLGVRKGRRDVSGKVAEEGRGGLWRRISGRVGSR